MRRFASFSPMLRPVENGLVAQPACFLPSPAAPGNLMSEPNIPDGLAERYRRMQRYVGWSDEDASRVLEVAPLVRGSFEVLIEDFYATIETEPQAAKVITGGREQVDRLKGTLCRWLEDLFHGPWSGDYVAARWRVGWRHVEIGLESVFTAVAFSRLRQGLTRVQIS